MNFNRIKLQKDFTIKRRELEKSENRIVSKKEIAENIGIGRVNLHRIITGEVVPNLRSLIAISKWIGNPIDDYVL